MATKMTKWNRIQATIRPTMSKESYRNWLAPVRFSHVAADKRLHLVAPNSDVQGWVESELGSAIVNAARTIGMDIRSLAIETEAPEPRLVQRSFEFDPKPSPFNPKYRFERFVVGACNEFAHAAAQAVVTRPGQAYNPLYLYSDVGMGKTHLLHAIGNSLHRSDPSMRVTYISAEEFMNEMIKSIRFNNMRTFHQRFRTADVLLVDDIQIIGSKERTQEEFFHTFNALHNRGKQIVISSDSDPEAIPGLVGRLKSRFSWGLMVDMLPPDLETKMAILDRKSEEAGVLLPEDVRSYIATHLHSNIRELEGVLNTLIARAQFINRQITLNMVRNVVGGLPRPQPEGPGIDRIKHAVAMEFKVPVAQLDAKNNTREVAGPRQIAMYLCKHLTNASLSEIGRSFKKHHTTVMHGIRKTEENLTADEKLRVRVDDLRARLDPPHSSAYQQ